MESVNPAAATKRRVFARLSIAAGNTLQSGGMVAAYFALRASRSAHSTAMAVIAMLLSWVLLYFFSHAIAHWLVGRVLGIRFLFYTVGGTGNALDGERQCWSQSPDVVCRCNLLGDHSDLGCILGVALWCSLE
jgi:hypothetical protein